VDDRATAPALTYVFAIGISAILVSGLLVSASGFVDDRRRETVREELEIVGERIGASIAAADAASDDGAAVERRMEVPATVVDTRYYVSVVDCAVSDTCLELTAPDSALSAPVTVPLANRSVVSVDRPRPGSITVVAAAGRDPAASADADVSVDPNIGVASDIDPAFSSSSAILGIDRSLVVSGFDYSPSPPSATEAITFTADVGGSGAGNLTYQWDFDDDGTFEKSGNATEAKTVTHTYADPGRYDVRLYVEDAAGENDSVTRLLRVSGLVFAGNKVVTDPDGNGESAGVRFDIENTFDTQAITITEVFIDPENPDIDRLERGYEIVVDSSPVTDDTLVIEESGSIADFEAPVTLSSNEQVSVEMGEFYGPSGQFGMSGQNVTVAFRYEIEGTKRNYVSQFDIETGLGGGGGGTGDPPVIDRADPYTVGDDLRVYLELEDPDGDLDSVTVDVLDDDGNVLRTRSADLSPYGDEANGYLPLGEYDPEVDAIRVTVVDDTGDEDTTTEAVDPFS
jgi:PKD repeat protein